MLVLRKLCLVLSVALAACSTDPPTKAGPCTRAELAGCGASCSAASVCPGGLYCDEGACQAQCTSATAAQDCGAGKLCSSEGRCERDPSAQDGGGELDAGHGTPGGNAGGDGGGGIGGGSDSNVCAEVTLDTTPKTPNVMLILDQSSSMDADFGSSNRWQVLRETLLASNGLIAELQNVVRFGATWYSARNESDRDAPAVGQCPMLTKVGIALDNFEAIRAAYPPDMIEDTPTGDSIEAILAELLGSGSVLDPQTSQDPTIFVLATDGEPDTCEHLDPQNGQQEAIDAVKRAHSVGINTYVIAVAEEDELSQQHINALANAGVGNNGGPQTESYRVDSDQGLRNALREIVGGVVTCEVRLEGTVTGDPCAADVRIGGTKLTCNGPDGFELLDPSLVRLKGSACEELKAGKQLTATFPCGGAV